MDFGAIWMRNDQKKEFGSHVDQNHQGMRPIVTKDDQNMDLSPTLTRIH